MFVFESGNLHCFEVCSILEYFSVQDIRPGNLMTRPVIFYWQKENFNEKKKYLYVENLLKIFLQNLPLDPPLDFLQGIVFSNVLSLSSQNLITMLSLDTTFVLDNKLMEINCATLNNLLSFLFLDLRISKIYISFLTKTHL